MELLRVRKPNGLVDFDKSSNSLPVFIIVVVPIINRSRAAANSLLLLFISTSYLLPSTLSIGDTELDLELPLRLPFSYPLSPLLRDVPLPPLEDCDITIPMLPIPALITTSAHAAPTSEPATGPAAAQRETGAAVDAGARAPAARRAAATAASAAASSATRPGGRGTARRAEDGSAAATIILAVRAARGEGGAPYARAAGE